MLKRPRWPMIVLRSAKGWTSPREVDGHYLEGFWRAHQLPIPDIAKLPTQPTSNRSKPGCAAISPRNSSTSTGS